MLRVRVGGGGEEEEEVGGVGGTEEERVVVADGSVPTRAVDSGTQVFDREKLIFIVLRTVQSRGYIIYLFVGSFFKGERNF